MDERIIPNYSELKRLLLIINPISGRRLSKQRLSELIKIFSDAGYSVTVFPTGRRGDAAMYAELYSAGADLVVCVGGDGTLSETVTGLVRSGSGVPLGHIPAGSTNDFAICHGLSADMLKAAENIVRGSERLIDVGSFGDAYFAYIAAFGAFSHLSYTTPQNRKNVLGHSAYLLDAVRELPKLRAQHLRFDFDGFSCEGDYIFGAICNSTSVAGTISLPEKLVDTGDGKFEVLLVHEPQTVSDFQNLLLGLMTQDYSSPFLDLFHVSSLGIVSPSGLEWSLDGEYRRSGERTEMTVLGRRLRLMA